MKTTGRLLVASAVVAVTVAVALVGGREADVDAGHENGPATVVHVKGSKFARVVLTALAAERTGVRTEQVREAADGLAVPYTALIYDPQGETWVYTSPERLAYVRAAVLVERIEGDVAYLSDGPDAGTDVVTVGGAELYGTEFEVGH
jgi:hypothetical protein